MKRRPGSRDVEPSIDLMSPVTEVRPRLRCRPMSAQEVLMAQDIGEPSSFVRPILRVLDEAEETMVRS
jgi:hypothetical protein